MQRCLSKEELGVLIDNDWKLPDDDAVDLSVCLYQSRYWESELICFSYFLSQVLERKAKNNDDCKQILEKAFQQTSEMWLSFQDFDGKFIKYLFRYIRDKDVLLENDLIEIQRNLGQHKYE